MKTKWILFTSFVIFWCLHPIFAQEDIVKYVRYSYQNKQSYGILDGETIEELSGNLFESPQKTGKKIDLSTVKLLAPCQPSKVIAVGLNYKSHLGNRPVPEYPGLFAKYPTCIIGTEENIIMPPEAKSLHYEGELVVVIGKKAKNVSITEAPNFIFGVTAGNDVSERTWQSADLQWLRAKASDTFGPLGPAIVRGLNYHNLLLQTKLNGEIRQSEHSKDLIYNVDEIVSYVSHYITLLPGDIIFTGTPGSTKEMKIGDTVEIEIEGIGILRNRVAAAPN
jgi:2-keto-4-pentenoate hydratase/2-oxohepta-3-ene-1,7-dioic acid hydratase in catechol pathway